MKRAVPFLLTLVLVMPALAGVEIEHDSAVDFGSYDTWAWGEGTPAARPEFQKRVVSDVEAELKRAGLRKVEGRRADVYVKSYAFAEMDSQIRANYLHIDARDFGVITSDVRTTTKGVLIVEMVDGESDKVVWRAIGKEVMSLPEEDKVKRKIDKIVRKMFKGYPPR